MCAQFAAATQYGTTASAVDILMDLASENGFSELEVGLRPNCSIGRERELALVSAMLGEAEDGMRIVCLRGPTGSGTTTMLTTVAAAPTIACCRQVWAPVGSGRSGTVDGGSRRASSLALAEALDLEQVSTSLAAADVDLAVDRLVRALEHHSEATPLVLFLDDAEQLDAGTLGALGQLAGRGPERRVRVVLAMHDDAGPAADQLDEWLEALGSTVPVQQVELRPLDDGTIEQLVRAAQPDISGLESIIEAAAGRPALALELAESVADGHRWSARGARGWIERRLADSSADACAVAELVATCTRGVPRRWVADALGARGWDPRRAEEALRAATSLPFLNFDDPNLPRVRGPELQEAVLAVASTAERRSLKAELIAAADNDPFQDAAAWSLAELHASIGQAREAASTLHAAARREERDGRLHAALDSLRAAASFAPDHRTRIMLLREAVRLALLIGSPFAPQLVRELVRLAARLGNDEAYAYGLFELYWLEGDGDDTARLHRAADLDPQTIGWSARAAACLCTLAGDYRAAASHDERALTIARERGDVALEVLAADKLALAWSWIGSPGRAIRLYREALDRAIEARLFAWALLASNNLADVLADELMTEQARHESERALRLLRETGIERLAARVEAQHALVAWKAGLASESLAFARRASAAADQAPEHTRAIVAVIHACAAVTAGDIADATTPVRIAMELAERSGFESFVWEARFVATRLLLRQGERERAVDEASKLRIDEPSSMAALARWAAREGVLHREERLVELAVQIAVSLDPDSAKVVQLTAEEISALDRARTSGVLEPLVESAERWRAHGRELDAATVLAVAGACAPVGSEQSMQLLRIASADLERCGAHGALDDLQRSFPMLSPALRRKGSGGLSKREHQIAALVAGGLRTGEAAAQLGVSPSTVSTHLNNTYRKLGVNNRLELAQALDQLRVSGTV